MSLWTSLLFFSSFSFLFVVFYFSVRFVCLFFNYLNYYCCCLFGVFFVFFCLCGFFMGGNIYIFFFFFFFGGGLGGGHITPPSSLLDKCRFYNHLGTGPNTPELSGIPKITLRFDMT